MGITEVIIWSTITALATGLGTIPIARQKGAAWGHAIAAGLMSAASLSLIIEGANRSLGLLLAGALVGILLIIIADKYLPEQEDMSFANLTGKDARRALMIIGIMTAHSFAEGVGLGVSWGEGESFGIYINSLIALHNIPEGLAIGLMLIPQGASRKAAAGWAIFSSLPQPLLAVPAYLFVLAFAPFLPFGLGLAAGAMLWMSFSHLLPEAKQDLSARKAYVTYAVSLALAILAYAIFQIPTA